MAVFDIGGYVCCSRQAEDKLQVVYQHSTRSLLLRGAETACYLDDSVAVSPSLTVGKAPWQGIGRHHTKVTDEVWSHRGEKKKRHAHHRKDCKRNKDPAETPFCACHVKTPGMHASFAETVASAHLDVYQCFRAMSLAVGRLLGNSKRHTQVTVVSCLSFHEMVDFQYPCGNEVCR
jgi:hypothetical protein